MTTFSSSGTINLDEWTHVAVVIDKENNIVKFFKNNQLEGTLDATYMNLVNDATKKIFIGKSSSDEYFDGLLDDVRLYDRAITNTELDEIYQEKYTKNLLLHYDFEQYQYNENKVFDESKNSSHGILMNKEIESEDFTKDIGNYAVVGTAFKPDVDQYIVIPTTIDNAVQGDNLNNCTFAAWVKTSNLNSYEPIIHKEGVFSFGLNYGHVSLQLGNGTTLHKVPVMTKMDEDSMVATTSGYNPDYPNLEFGIFMRNGTTIQLRTYEENTTIYKRTANGFESVYGIYPIPYTQINVALLTNESLYTKNNQVVGIDSTNMRDNLNYWKTHIRGKHFVNKSGNAADTVYILPHHDNTTIQYQTSARTSAITTVVKNKYETFSFVSSNQWSIVSDRDISVIFNNGATSYNSIGYPADREIFGFVQGINYVYLMNTKNMSDTNSYTVNYQYTNSPTLYTFTVQNGGQSAALTNMAYQTSAVRVWLDSDVPDGIVICGYHYSDGDGGDGSSYIPRKYLSRRFVVPSTTSSAYHRVIVSFKEDGTASTNYLWYQGQTVSTAGVLGAISTINPTYRTEGTFASLNMSTGSYTQYLITCSEDSFMMQHYTDDEEIFIGDMYRYFVNKELLLNRNNSDAVEIKAPNEHLLTELNFDKPSEYSDTTLALTEGYTGGGVGVKINESQHIELSGETFSNNNMNTMTFSTWLKPDKVDGSQPILSRFGVENNIKLKMVNSELVLSINNSDKPMFKDIEVLKIYDSTNNSFKINISGIVSDSSQMEMYVLALFNNYTTYMEDALIKYVKANMVPEVFDGNNMFNKFERQITNYKRSLENNLTSSIYYDSNFDIYLIAIDSMNNVSIEMINNKTIVSDQVIDETFNIRDLSVRFNEDVVDANFVISTPVGRGVDLYAVAYINQMDFPENFVKVLDSTILTAGLVDSQQKIELNKAYSDFEGTLSVVNDLSLINMIHVYIYAIDPQNGQRISLSNSIIPDNVEPYTQMESPLYVPFEQTTYIPETTLFSGFTDIKVVYPVVAFSADVDLSNNNAVKNFFVANIEPLTTELELPISQYDVVQLINTTVSEAYYALSKDAKGPVDREQSYQFRMYVIDELGNGRVEIIGGGSEGIDVKDVNWNINNFVPNGENYQITTFGVWVYKRFDGSGTRMITSSHVNNSSGWCRIYEYNAPTDEWGKFDVSGAFTANTYHDLSKSSTFGNYGICSTISADGKTVLVGCRYDYYRGEAYVWQFDEATWSWGKYNADGSFTAGTPHGLNTFPKTTHPYCHYGDRVCLTGNGKRALVGGHYNDNNQFRAWIWDYDELTATWGTYNSSGTFVAGEGHMIYKSGSSWGYAGVCLSMSIDGKTLLFTNYTGNTSGKGGVMYYNEETYQWGKYNTDGSFVVHDPSVSTTLTTDYYDVSYSGIYAHYGIRSTMADDGKSLFIGGWHNADRGVCTVWQFKEDTYEWGKYNDDGSFTAGTPHILEHTGTGANMGHGMDISADGKTVIISGHNATNGRAFIWEYNDTLARWGRFLEDGTFQTPTSTGDHTALHYIHYNTISDFGSSANISPNGVLVSVYGSGNQKIWRGIERGTKSVVPYGTGGNITTLSTLAIKLNSVEFKELEMNGGKITVYNTDWSNETNNHDNSAGDYVINVGYTYGYNRFSGDSKKLITTKHINNSSGYARIYEYNEETDAWGKFEANGAFTADAFHDLYKVSTLGNYGLGSGMSYDGNTCAVGGYFDHTGRGALFVWQYDSESATWGKFNADGSFTSNLPHDLSNPANWGGYYVQSNKITLSGNGKKLCMGSNGHTNNGRIWIFDYDDETATWGRKYPDGSFKPFTTGDLTTVYVIEMNATDFGHNAYMSGDGKTISVGKHVSNNQGYVYVWKFDDETMEWGRWNSDGSFTPITTNTSTGIHTWTTTSYYDLNRNSTVSNYGGRPNTLSTDGKTLLVAYNYDHTRGRGYIWEYDEETHQWGKFNADGTFVAPTSNTDVNSPHMTEKTGAGGNYGHDSEISADGKSFIQGGHYGGGTAWIWEYDDATATWGGFNAAGVFTVNNPHRIYNGTSNFAYWCIMSPDNRFVVMSSNSNNMHIFKGIVRVDNEVRTIVKYEELLSRGIAPAIEFKGEISSDKNRETTYYAFGTLKEDLTNEQVRSIIKDPANKTVVFKSEKISSGISKKKFTHRLSHVYDVNNNLVESHKVNYVVLYVYATDGIPEHDDISKKYAKIEYLPLSVYSYDLYSVVSVVNYDKFVDISFIEASIMSSKNPIVSYYKPIPFTDNIDITNLAGIKQFVIDNSELVLDNIEPKIVKNIDLEINQAYDNLNDPSITTTVDPSKPNDYKFFMVLTDNQGNTEVSTNFSPPITSVSDIGAKIRTTSLIHNHPNFNKSLIKILETDWSNETTLHDNTGGDYTLPTHSGNETMAISSGPLYRILHTRHLNTTSGDARVYEYNSELSQWGKFDPDGTFTQNAYHDLSMTGTLGNYGLTCAISADGNTCLVGGHNGTQGAMFVWQYDKATSTWGKYNADGTFSTGVAHDCSKTGMGVNYGNGSWSQLTLDGKRFCIGGPSGTDGRIWIWDYNSETATWGTYDETGTFIENEPYTIRGSLLDSSFTNFAESRYMSGDGKTIVSSKHINNNSGNCRVLKYDEATYSWGAYNSSGKFEKNKTYNLDLSSTTSNYGFHSRLSFDGDTLLVFGHYNSTQGRGYIWKYDHLTHKWGKYINGVFAPGEPYMTEKTGVHGNYGHGGDMSADGNTFVMSGHSTYGTAYIWQYNIDTGEWGGYDSSRVFTKDGAHRIYFTGAGAIGQSSYMSPDSKIMIMRNGTTNFYIYNAFKISASYIRMYPPSLTFDGTMESTSTENTTSNYYIMATTNDLTRYQARQMLLNYQAKSSAIVVGNMGGYTKDEIIRTKINNVITENGKIVPSNRVNRSTVYFYATQMYAPLDTGYEDLEIRTLSPSYTSPYAVVSIVQSSFSDELIVSGSVFSIYHDINKVYMLLFDATVNLDTLTDQDFKTIAENNLVDTEMTLTSTTKYNLGTFNIKPTKVFTDNVGTISDITTYESQYQVRLVCLDTASNLVVVRPTSEETGEYTVPTSLTVSVNEIEFTSDNTIRVHTNTLLQSYREYDVYMIAFAKPDMKTDLEVRAMLFDESKYKAVKYVQGETRRSIEMELSHVVDVVNDRVVLAEQVNNVQVYVYVKGHGTLVGEGFEDIANLIYNTNLDPVASVAEVEYIPYLDRAIVKEASTFTLTNKIVAIYPLISIGSEIDFARSRDDIIRFILNNFTPEAVSLENQQVNMVPNLPLDITHSYTDLTDISAQKLLGEYDNVVFLVRDESAQDIVLTDIPLNITGYSLGKLNITYKDGFLRVIDVDWSTETNNHDNTAGDYQITGMPYTYMYIAASGINSVLTYRHINTISGYGRIFQYNEKTDQWGKFGPNGSFTANTYYDLYMASMQGNYGLGGGISLDGKTCALGGYNTTADGRGSLLVWQYDEESATWGKYNADRTFETGVAHDLSNPANWSGAYVQNRKIYLTGNGDRLMVSGNGSSNMGRIWIFDYDKDTATWGRKYPDGSFKEFAPNDYTTVYIIEMNVAAMGANAVMSGDGKTISVGRNVNNQQGYVYVWKFNTNTMEWGRWNTDGTFTPITTNADTNIHTWTVESYYDLERINARSHYGRINSPLSVDGNTLLVANYYDASSGRAYIWQYNVLTNQWGKYNTDGSFVVPTSTSDTLSPATAERIGITGNYGINDSDISADGKSFVQGGSNGGGTTFLWEYDDKTAAWGGFDAYGSFTENDPHRFYSGTSNFSYYLTLSPENKFLYITANTSNLHIFKGFSREKVRSLVQYTRASNGIPSKSTLRGIVKKVSIDTDTVSFDVNVVSENYPVHYYIIATTYELNEVEGRTFKDNAVYASAILSGTVEPNMNTNIVSTLLGVVDNASTEHKVVSPQNVNRIYLYAYTTDGDLSKDDLDYMIYDNGLIGPYLSITNVSEYVVGATLTISGAAFSSRTNITEFKIGVFEPNIDISDPELLKQFMRTHGTAINTEPIPQYTVYSLVNVGVTSVFNSTNLSVGTSSILQNNRDDYQVILYAIDESNNESIQYYIIRFELFDPLPDVYKYNYISLNTDRYFWNKRVNNKWCDINENGMMVFAWSSTKNTNTRDGVYVVIANPKTSSKSAVFEVKYDTTYHYVLPCIACINNNTFVVAYLATNGSSYNQTIHYNIITHDDTNITNSTEYTFGIEKVDPNMIIDIHRLSDNNFIFVFDDYAQHPQYVSCNCGRHGCGTCHVGWYYYYDIQYVIKDLNNTTILDRTLFENNDTNYHYHKLTTPSIGVSTSYYTIVYQYYAEIYTYSMRISDNAITTNNIRVNTTTLPGWNVNDPLPVAIESFTTDYFVYVWYTNQVDINTMRRIFMRELNAATGAYITNEIIIDEFSTTDNKYIVGRPKIFKNTNYYDLFVIVKDKPATNLLDHNTYRLHYKISNNATFTVMEKTELLYSDENFDVMETIGNPISMIELSTGKYQENIIHTSTVGTTQFDLYDILISSGPMI